MMHGQKNIKLNKNHARLATTKWQVISFIRKFHSRCISAMEWQENRLLLQRKEFLFSILISLGWWVNRKWQEIQGNKI